MLQPNRIILFYFFCALSILPIRAYTSPLEYIFPYSYPTFSNYGTIGLVQNPTARFLSTGSLAFSWSHNDPYLRGSIVAYPFNWLEASYQYADINNVLYSEVEEFSGSQSLKDKSFDIKLKLLNETKALPQIAIGLRDVGGTGRFSSEFLALNKFIGNVDYSIGIGWGNLNGNQISNPLRLISQRFNSRESSDQEFGGEFRLDDFFSGRAGIFGGVEIYLPNSRGKRIKVEYDGINYKTESDIPLQQDSKFNFGLVIPASNNFTYKISYTRGNTLSFGFSFSLNLADKNPLKIKKERNLIVDNPEIVQRVTGTSDDRLYRASLLYLNRGKINLQHASVEDDDETLHVVYAQSGIRSSSQSVGRTIDIIDQIAPKKIKYVRATQVNGGMAMLSAFVDRESYKRYKNFNSPELGFQMTSFNSYNHTDKEFKFNPSIKYPAFFASIGPDLRSQIGGPDGFFFGDLKATLDTELLLSRNLSLVTIASYGIIDNMDELKLESDSILPHVRTDIVKYLKESRNFSIRRMQLNYYKKFNESIYLKVAGGIFESMFQGYGFEMLYRPFSKNFGLGLELWQVEQRAYDQMFSTLNYATKTGHFNFFYQEPRTNILFSFKGGRYLARDSGFTLDFSKIFRSGLRMGAFFSLTDISSEEFGEGSFDKGFYFWIPVDIFTQRYIKRTFGWGLRPITRDGAQTLIHGYPLWGVTNSASIRNLYDSRFDYYD